MSVVANEQYASLKLAEKRKEQQLFHKPLDFRSDCDCNTLGLWRLHSVAITSTRRQLSEKGNVMDILLHM